jgi:hypothetical protein
VLTAARLEGLMGLSASRNRRLTSSGLIIGAVVVLVAQSVLTATTATAVVVSAVPRAANAATAGALPPATGPADAVQPNGIGELDCNGLSPVQRAAKAAVMCTDPRGSDEGRFFENGHYIGHDEPSVRFISNQAGSGSDTTFNEQLPTDPAAAPTVKTPGKDVTHWFELSVAPWISTVVCDPNSAPLTACTPGSDANAPKGNFQGGGAAFVELQFYPPGFAPFADSISCDNTHWCSALTIDSLECTGDGSGACNDNCIEPVNFGFIQTDGKPPGPPSPQLSDDSTFTPDGRTLLMNPGDKISVRLFNAKIAGGHALEAQETDFTTGKSGFMIASAANGFMNTNPFDCTGTPFNFQPSYSSARAQNIIPWGIGPYMINNQFEIGHFEPCTTVSGRSTTPINGINDVYFNECHGPYEAAKDTVNTFEPDDSPCYQAGDTHQGLADPNLVTGCDVFFDAIGDLDYDGNSYRADWPSSTTAGPFPTPFLQQQPTTVGGSGYPQIQFVTDTTATEFNTDCDLTSGSGCVLPPKGPGHFYPYFTQAKVGGSCVWEFGNMRNGNTFGGDAQYGAVGPGTLGAFASPIRANPNC